MGRQNSWHKSACSFYQSVYDRSDLSFERTHQWAINRKTTTLINLEEGPQKKESYNDKKNHFKWNKINYENKGGKRGKKTQHHRYIRYINRTSANMYCMWPEMWQSHRMILRLHPFPISTHHSLLPTWPHNTKYSTFLRLRVWPTCQVKSK